MKTVDELVYYCQECEPVGALLLSGEWGCGKTYLIEHELKDALADTSVILRISLFGMTLPEEIHAAIRFKWMEEYCRIKGISNVFEKLGQGKKWLSKMEFLPEWLRGIGKTDVSELFNIGKEMEGMTVVLVFDDLERCRMSSVDVLGVINDYCENQHYHTIIVANQAKIKGQREITKITGKIQQVPAESDTRKSENNKAITSEIEIIKKRNNTQSAPEIIKSNRIMDIDDAVIHEGFADFLRIAYDGNLTLDEYVLLIENSCWARSYKCDLPLPIDWKKVQTGIGLRIAEIKKAPPEGQLLFSTISETQRFNFTDEEWSAYELISKFALGDELIFYRNKKLYIDKIRELGLSAFMFIENKRYDVFDEEMATATAQAFSKENNAGKNQFISNFKNLWEFCIQSSDIRIEDSIKGFQLLKVHLKEVLAKAPRGKRDFSIAHTERFVSILNKLIDIYKEELSKREDSQDI